MTKIIKSAIPSIVGMSAMLAILGGVMFLNVLSYVL